MLDLDLVVRFLIAGFNGFVWGYYLSKYNVIRFNSLWRAEG